MTTQPTSPRRRAKSKSRPHQALPGKTFDLLSAPTRLKAVARQQPHRLQAIRKRGIILAGPDRLALGSRILTVAMLLGMESSRTTQNKAETRLQTAPQTL